MSISPSPPSFLALRVYSIWENLESTEQATTSHPTSLNYLALLLNAIISVGQTKVKSNGQKNNTKYFPLQSESFNVLKSPWNQAGASKQGACFLTSDISNLYIKCLIRNHTYIYLNRLNYTLIFSDAKLKFSIYLILIFKQNIYYLCFKSIE